MTAAANPASLAEALARLQAALPRVAKEHEASVTSQRTGKTHKYSYADLTDVSDAILPLLAALGLAFTACPTILGDSGRFVLDYALRHVSGDQVTGLYPLPDPDRLGPQDLGKAITYARRYALCAVTGLAPGGDDDDAQAAQAAVPAQRRSRNVPDAQLAAEGRMTRGQAAEHDRLAAGGPGHRPASRSRPRAPEPSQWDTSGPVDPDTGERDTELVTPHRAQQIRGQLNGADLTEPEDKPGSILPGQKNALERLLSMLGIETGNRETRHLLCAGWAGLDDLASLNDLSAAQAADCIRAAQDAVDKEKARA